TIAFTPVSIFTQIDTAVARDCRVIRNWFDIVDTAAVVIKAAGEKRPKFFAHAKAPANGPAKLGNGASIQNGSESANHLENHSRSITRGLGDQIHRPANCVGILIGG